MLKAWAACPAAVVIRPDMAKYREMGGAVRAAMMRLTPLVEPLSIDEAFLDLSGTAGLHNAAPAQLLAGLARRGGGEFRLPPPSRPPPQQIPPQLAPPPPKPPPFSGTCAPETTFAKDRAVAAALAHWLGRLCEKVAARLKEAPLAAGTVTLKLKTGDFRLRTRSHALAEPTQLADTLFQAADRLLKGEADG